MSRRFPSLASNPGKTSRKTKIHTIHPQQHTLEPKGVLTGTRQQCPWQTGSVTSVSPSSDSAWNISNLRTEMMWMILLSVHSYLHCKTAHICNWLVQTCATAYSSKIPNASTWTSARGKHYIWPPAPMVQLRQVHARICSVAYSVTSCCLFFNALCSSYSAVSS